VSSAEVRRMTSVNENDIVSKIYVQLLRKKNFKYSYEWTAMWRKRYCSH